MIKYFFPLNIFRHIWFELSFQVKLYIKYFFANRKSVFIIIDLMWNALKIVKILEI
jgi:hypothetical protein